VKAVFHCLCGKETYFFFGFLVTLKKIIGKIALKKKKWFFPGTGGSYGVFE